MADSQYWSGGLTMRLISGFLLVALLAACTAGPSRPDEATTCGQLADLAVEAVTDARDAAVNSSQEDFNLLRGDASAIIRTLDDDRQATSVQFVKLGCDQQEWDADVLPRVLDLAPRSTGGIAVIQIGLLWFSFGGPMEELGGSLFP